MPFKSEKQRKWMWANKPELARKWEKHGRSGNGKLGYKKKPKFKEPLEYKKNI